MNPTVEITGYDLAKKAGVTPRQITHWFAKGYIKFLQGGSSSHPRVMEMNEVTIAVRMGKMIRLGFTPAKAAEVARLTHTKREEFAKLVEKELAY